MRPTQINHSFERNCLSGVKQSSQVIKLSKEIKNSTWNSVEMFLTELQLFSTI